MSGLMSTTVWSQCQPPTSPEQLGPRVVGAAEEGDGQDHEAEHQADIARLKVGAEHEAEAGHRDAGDRHESEDEQPVQ